MSPLDWQRVAVRDRRLISSPMASSAGLEPASDSSVNCRLIRWATRRYLAPPRHALRRARGPDLRRDAFSTSPSFCNEVVLSARFERAIVPFRKRSPNPLGREHQPHVCLIPLGFRVTIEQSEFPRVPAWELFGDVRLESRLGIKPRHTGFADRPISHSGTAT